VEDDLNTAVGGDAGGGDDSSDEDDAPSHLPRRRAMVAVLVGKAKRLRLRVKR
jgi:hypothetical protein